MMAMVVMARTLFNTLIIPVLIIAAGRFTVQYSTVLYSVRASFTCKQDAPT